MDLTIRRAAPSHEPNNPEILIWACHLLGGGSKLVDVEDIYFKAFELAPKRFGWRTRPDIPNFKKANQALIEIELRSHQGLLQKMGPNSRRFTPEGVGWVEKYSDILASLYGDAGQVAVANNSDFARMVREIKQSEVWSLWRAGKVLNMTYLGHVLNCSKASAESVWLDRLADLDQAARISSDEEVAKFAIEARIAFEKGT
jgi:hypothetical protein